MYVVLFHVLAPLQNPVGITMVWWMLGNNAGNIYAAELESLQSAVVKHSVGYIAARSVISFGKKKTHISSTGYEF